MQILLTGSSGFLGKSILKGLKDFNITTIGRTNANIICDLSKKIPNLPAVDLVIHAAGKAHIVPKTEEEKQDFFDVNVTGTENLLKGIEQSSSLPLSFVFISSVSVYGLESGENIKEDHPLNAKETYGLSKIQAEKIISEWCQKHNVICTILRLPLLVGDNPPGNLAAMINGIKKGYYMNIAGGLAKKSMVKTDDVANAIIPASLVGGIYNLTDGYHPSFKELSNYIAQQLGKTTPFNIPNWIATLLATFGDIIGKKSPFNTYKLSKIKADLTFDDIKAKLAFGWRPRPILQAFTFE
jgi:nucleoside-diphosphate-sugar epimerase